MVNGQVSELQKALQEAKEELEAEKAKHQQEIAREASVVLPCCVAALSVAALSIAALSECVQSVIASGLEVNSILRLVTTRDGLDSTCLGADIEHLLSLYALQRLQADEVGRRFLQSLTERLHLLLEGYLIGDQALLQSALVCTGSSIVVGSVLWGGGANRTLVVGNLKVVGADMNPRGSYLNL